MNNTLPPLPEPYWSITQGYTADQLREYAAQAVQAAIEACAQLVNDDRGLSDDDAIRVCRAIRARGKP